MGPSQGSISAVVRNGVGLYRGLFAYPGPRVRGTHERELELRSRVLCKVGQGPNDRDFFQECRARLRAPSAPPQVRLLDLEAGDILIEGGNS